MGIKLKSASILVNIEPDIHTLVIRMLNECNMGSASGYGRSLIIKDLIARGYLSEKQLSEILIGHETTSTVS